MLFSNDSVATVINSNFEPVWVSVRPVPQVTIDFGNGNVVRRTLHGNVATYACTADGNVLDILPGIYEPQTYIDRLRQMVLLHRFVQQTGSADELPAILKNYHRRQFNSLADNELPLHLQERGGGSILATEGPTRLVLLPHERMAARGNPAHRSESNTRTTSEPDPIRRAIDGQDLGSWQLLQRDTQLNETVRRKAIHEYLKDRELIKPEQMTKWLYREVLHADLDDPYLGLGKILFDTYPFAAEDGY